MTMWFMNKDIISSTIKKLYYSDSNINSIDIFESINTIHVYCDKGYRSRLVLSDIIQFIREEKLNNILHESE